eukprot:1879368-Rhodomonas_salina.1
MQGKKGSEDRRMKRATIDSQRGTLMKQMERTKRAVLLARGESQWLAAQSVSYTHLTLPTICSV